MAEAVARHWEHVYESRATDEVSWFQIRPATSLRLVEGLVGTDGAVVDIGSGASSLLDNLLSDGYQDITVVDVSDRALQATRERLGERSAGVTFVRSDVLDWEPGRTFDVWHDRAVFHFLTGAEARSGYARLAAKSVAPGGSVVIATFAADGPTHCSALRVSRYDADELAAQFNGDFDLVHSERETHVTPGGVSQPFTWAVLRRR